MPSLRSLILLLALGLCSIGCQSDRHNSAHSNDAAAQTPLPVAGAPEETRRESDEAAPPATAITAASGPPEARVELRPGLRVDRARREIEVDGVISLDAGMLEQIACARGTREHESIFVPSARPSEIHAALLLAGFEPGRPGRWEETGDGGVVVKAPEGDRVEILLRVESAEFRPISLFIRDARSGRAFPPGSFVFAGSAFASNPPSLGPGEHYVADWTGSIVGLVTFGDEVIGWPEVIPDRAEIADPVWEANPLRLPQPGTPATLLLRQPSPSSR